MNVRGELSAFKQFVLKGNIIDIAAGTLASTVFSGLVTSLTRDILSPVLGLLSTKPWDNHYHVLRKGPNAPYKDKAAAIADGAIVLTWGVFIETTINAALQTVCLFILIRAVYHVTRYGRAKIGV